MQSNQTTLTKYKVAFLMGCLIENQEILPDITHDVVIPLTLVFKYFQNKNASVTSFLSSIILNASLQTKIPQMDIVYVWIETELLNFFRTSKKVEFQLEAIKCIKSLYETRKQHESFAKKISKMLLSDLFQLVSFFETVEILNDLIEILSHILNDFCISIEMEWPNGKNVLKKYLNILPFKISLWPDLNGDVYFLLACLQYIYSG